MDAFDPLRKLKEFISYPSVSADSAFAAGMKDAREFLEKTFAELGLVVETVPTPLHPILLARREGPAEWPHVVIYGHYDVQPPDPLNLWESPAFEPTERDGRLYGRGAADNKGPLMVHLSAVAQLLRDNPDLPLRITFLVEGEEEIGSPSFVPFLETHKDKLDAEFVLLSDTGSPRPDQIVITTGLRGIVCVEAELTGPRTDLHSGVHGGAVENPLRALVRLCASLHDADGRVNIPGFYDAVTEVQPWEREQVSRLGQREEEYAEFLGVDTFGTTPGFTPFEAVRFQPTLEFNGLGGGYQGEGSKTVIPSKAMVKISCRLVAGQDPQDIQEKLLQTLRERCPAGVKLECRTAHCGAPYRVVPPHRPDTPANLNPYLAKAYDEADRAITEAFGNAPLYLREGGSVPIIADLKTLVGLDSLMIGLFLPEDNLHAPNESFHLGVMEKGITVSRRILQHIAEQGAKESMK
ncbi:MAG: M20/M25/M40 family metallo-hydrolase [Opitutales bacterium]|nr:M20/M25/M40 family metallo-hydrolase [Opitutales bacterium]